MLHLGVGTGHTTALLTHLLSAEHVTAVEIDPTLLRLAERRIGSAGPVPALVTGDAGSLHDPSLVAGEFDRILVGFETDVVPTSWTSRVTPGGLLMVRLIGGLGAGGHVLFERSTGGAPILTSRFLPWTGPLSARRRPVSRRAVRWPSAVAGGFIRTHSTPVDPARPTADSPLGLLAQLLAAPGTPPIVALQRFGHRHLPSGARRSWAEIEPAADRSGRFAVREAGPTRLTRSIDAVAEVFDDLRRLAWTDFGVTVQPSGSYVWHYNADSGPRWPLPAARPR